MSATRVGVGGDEGGHASAMDHRAHGNVASVDERSVAMDDAGRIDRWTGNRASNAAHGVAISVAGVGSVAGPCGVARHGDAAKPGTATADNKKAATRAAEGWGIGDSKKYGCGRRVTLSQIADTSIFLIILFDD